MIPAIEDLASRRLRVIALALAILTLLLYWPVRNHDFLNYDDHLYVTENKTVQQGLTLEGVVWAFNAPHVSNWHPLTWLSHMMDCTLFGLDAGAHHVVNLLFHVANTVMLFLLLARLTGAIWPAALVAALFAWHPLHVESVAWVAERKDVLSTFFWLLTLGAYARYTERPGKVRYTLTLAWFTLGLMAKPMLVTLPFVLLLLDVWPLRRLRQFGSKISGSWNEPESLEVPLTRPAGTLSPSEGERAGVRGRASTLPSVSKSAGDLAQDGKRSKLPASPAIPIDLSSTVQPLSRLVMEKWPFFVLSAIFSIIALLTQRDVAMVPMKMLPLAERLSNALIAYVRYAGKMFWPVDLAVFYPFPDAWPLWMTAAAGMLLALVTWIVCRMSRARPYLLVGWLWYCGTLVPVIGLVQVGSQSLADRYTYVPLIGLFIALAWGLADLWSRWPRGRTLVGIATGMALLACLALTQMQLRHWKNSVLLFEQAVRVTRDNWIAHYNLGLALAKAGRTDDAITHYRAVMRINSGNLDAVNNLGNVLENQGRHAEAAALFTAVLKVIPDDADALNNLGLALSGAGKPDEAIAFFARALQARPGFAKAHQNRGLALGELGRDGEAIAEFEAALKADPDLVEAHVALAFALTKVRRLAEARRHYEEALRLKPDQAEAHTGLGLALAALDKVAEAEAHLTEAAWLKPDDSRVLLYLGSVLARQGKRAAAVERYREAHRRSPDWPPLLANYAWLLATAPESSLRNGQLAVQLAERACELTNRQMAGALDALAAACAETGRFTDATTAAQQAATLSKAAGQDRLAAEIQSRMELYRAGRPFHEQR